MSALCDDRSRRFFPEYSPVRKPVNVIRVVCRFGFGGL